MWQWRHSRTATGQRQQHQRCCAIPELWRGEADDGKVGFEKEILKPGTGPKPVKGQKVTVHCTGYGKDGDLSQKFWSTKDKGQREFTFTIGMGSVIKGWDEGVLTMQVGELARITCTPDYGYGASGFPAWGIRPNSELVFEIEVLSAKSWYQVW
ncbi:peptidyl-prolyl cis-trans isomerase FKBP12-like [Lolium rigidum]|uniref:peptidyl-prolyl cis-trans isomerase FKBP12-like n=1 Tax=Lolium rigidum TaxID=89674 RepID=UPI001F5C4B65|nr:peptidyl-prolyl cis-trans isomerase FKBP12-like [Lolium rigidum]